MKNLFSFLFFSLFVSTMCLNAQENNKLFLQKAKPDLIKAFQNNQNEFWIVFAEQADVSRSQYLSTKEEMGEYVFKKLTETADRTQAKFLPLLKTKAISYKQYWIANMIYVQGDIELAKECALFHEVKELLPNPKMQGLKPIDVRPDDVAVRNPTATSAIEWGLTKVKAPSVWALGFKGQGTVVGGGDTGYDWDHPALKNKYRGWNGSTVDHNYNWHDAVHSGGGSCGANSKVACDDSQHGTHTMGTMVGSAGTNEIGMAPEAKWIGCRNMNVNVGTPTSYNECFQWLLAPTDLNDQNPMPSKAPHVINNSWGCPTSEGCNSGNFSTMNTIVNNLRAAGIVVVVSAGNDGSSCNTIYNAPTFFEGSFTVGSTTSSDQMSSFSSRGNITVDGSNRIKPNVSAPGSDVRSCVPGTGYSSMSGTSMAGPHVAGAVALLISSAPSLAGKVSTIEDILEKTAVKLNMGQTCGGTSPTTFPNNTVGHGRIDILAAINYATSVVEAQQKNSFSIFPNPAHDKVSIRFHNIKDQHAVITLFNTAGQTVAEKTGTIYNNAFETSVQDLPGGFYMVRIKTGDSSYYNKLIKE